MAASPAPSDAADSPAAAAFDVRVGFGGRSATASPQHEGIAELRHRVAGAFGLASPGACDLSASGGGEVQEASRAALLADADEDALLELERAHEESGAMRWQLLHKLFAGLRRQVAELTARQALFDEHLAAECAARDASDAALRGDLKVLAADMETQISRTNHATRSAIDDAVVTMVSNFEASIKKNTIMLEDQVAALQEKLRATEEARLKGCDEMIRIVETLREERRQDARAHEDSARVRVEFEKSALEPYVQSMISAETSARQQGFALHQGLIEALSESIKAEAAERRASEDRAIASATEAAEREAKRLVAETTVHHSETFSALESRVADAEGGRSAHIASIRDECAELRSLIIAEKESWARAHEALSSSESSKSEALKVNWERWRSTHADEIRDWARMLVEKLETNMRGERTTALAELRKELEDSWRAGTAAISTRLENEARRLEEATVELARSQQAARIEERKHNEAQAKLAAAELRGALDAQVEFAEALECEQRLLMERVGEGLGREDARRSQLSDRVSAIESDVKKVRDHLPILFVSPSAFG